jgi:hypothetical protein
MRLDDWRPTSFGRVRKATPWEAARWPAPETPAPRGPSSRDLLLAWDRERLPLAEQAQRLGLNKGALSARRRRLIQAGAIAPWQPGAGNHWTAADVDRLRLLIEQGHGYTTIARRLKRTRTAVKLKCKRLGLGVTTSEAALSCRDVAAILGLRCSKVVTRWLDMGLLKATNAGEAQRPLWRIQWEALTDFLERRDYWMAWTPARIPDPALREWATEIRAGGRWLTPGQVARRFHVERTTPDQWRQKGLVRCVRYGNWWYWEPDLVGFVIPSERPRPNDLHADGLPARILPLLPATVETLAEALQAKPKSVRQALNTLRTRGLAQRTQKRGGVWFR